MARSGTLPSFKRRLISPGPGKSLRSSAGADESARRDDEGGANRQRFFRPPPACIGANERKQAVISNRKDSILARICLLELSVAVLVGKLQKVGRRIRLLAPASPRCGYSWAIEVGLIQQGLLRCSVLSLVDKDIFGPAELLGMPKIKLTHCAVVTPFHYDQILGPANS